MTKRLTEKLRMKKTGSLSERAEVIIKVMRRELGWTRARVFEDAFTSYDRTLMETGWEITEYPPILVVHKEPPRFPQDGHAADVGEQLELDLQ